MPAATATERWLADGVAARDVNTDGRVDLVLTLDAARSDGSGGWLPSTRVLFGNGSGAFSASPAEFVPAVDLGAPTYAAPSFLQGAFVLLGDLDGDTDLSDFARLQACLGTPLDPGCSIVSLDASSNIDTFDVSLFIGCLSGAGVPYSPACN